MKAFTEPVKDLKAAVAAKEDLRRGVTPVGVSGCTDSQKWHFLHCLGEDYPVRLVITYDETRARAICEDVSFFDRPVMYYPAKDLIFYSADVHGDLIGRSRLAVLNRLAAKAPVTIVTTVDGLADRLMPPARYCSGIRTLKPGDLVDADALYADLTAMGFVRSGQVDGPGQFAVRGGIIDIYNAADPGPCRVELFGDEVDTIRYFDVDSQRSSEEADSFTIYPAAEYILTREMIDRGLHLISGDVKALEEKLKKEKARESLAHLKQMSGELKERFSFGGDLAAVDGLVTYFFEETASLLDYLPEGRTLVVVDEPAKTEEAGARADLNWQSGMLRRLEKGAALQGQLSAHRPSEESLKRVAAMTTLCMSVMPAHPHYLAAAAEYSVNVRSIVSYRGDLKRLVDDLRTWQRKRYRVILVCSTAVRANRFSGELMNYDLMSFYSADPERVPAPGETMLVHGGLHKGIEYPDIKFVIVSESDMFGEKKASRRRRRRSTARGEQIRSFEDLKAGDYVVHEHRGIGIYQGIEKMELDDVIQDYLVILYGDGGKLYVPVSQLDEIQKYAEKSAEGVKLNRLDNRDWNKTRSRVRGAVRELAEDLVRLYAVRQSRDGFACGADTVWQREFEDQFPFEETQDQLEAIEEIKKDMESTKIMDRLLCGDVGFGKTEVAIRAAFKMVQESRQCAVLVPTTVLAQQHFQTFTQRMKDYPVNIGLLSRFRSRADQKQTLEALKTGQLDIIIGTHRLLSKDVEFQDLGLLIVDEEQRFGVSHKEKIKKLKETVDVLTLTATPIPRTMHMSMIGIRDMSVLNEAPQDRQPIQTYVMEFDEEMVREAILREVGRGGQVYYVYNRVRDIDELTAKLAALVPEAEVDFVHGQMNERVMEDVMYRFINGEIDVLVSTTIIETGLDIPNVNTMIIHDSDRFGLSQLYQLRGRVGRSYRTAYAFLLYKRDKLLKEVAEKRLSAIREFTDLGSGYRIAMRDLEIRGAGSLLGERQSGHMASVGYDLYCKLLGEAIQEARGEEVREPYETRIDIEIDAFLPDAYIRGERQKIYLYKKIAAMQNEEDYDDLTEEMIDRYGEPPGPAQNLLLIALIKALLHEAYVIRLVHREHVTRAYMYERAMVDVRAIPELVASYEGRLKFDPKGKNPCFILDMKGFSGRRLLIEEKKFAKAMVQKLCGKPQASSES